MARSYLEGLLRGNRRALSRAITLVESTRSADQQAARELLQALPDPSHTSLRIGVSGPPGVGKSTFLEAFGLQLAEQNNRVAVLAVDPSSTISGGSILGDKTRMPRLSLHPNAFIRPSPSSGTLGGATQRSLEIIRLLEAAGFNRIFVESVGVGQSETALSRLTDCFLLMALPNSGDELQGIKRGIMEVADLVFVTKSDLDKDAALRTSSQIESALHLFRPRRAFFEPWVGTGSALTCDGLVELEQKFQEYEQRARETNALYNHRRKQLADWFENLVQEAVWQRFRASHGKRMEGLSRALMENKVSLGQALEDALQ